LFAHLGPEAAARHTRLENTAEGLAASLRLAGTGAQVPLWDRLAELAMPVLLVAGEHDAKFRALAERMAAAIGTNATVALVTGAGHAAHLEQPDAFCWLVEQFLADDPGH
jgi:pimeloyl-ACP methyl ester carboxylesterase